MSRYKEFTDAIAKQNRQGGVGYEKWIMFILTDIALSLATIADVLTKAEEESECTMTKSKD